MRIYGDETIIEDYKKDTTVATTEGLINWAKTKGYDVRKCFNVFEVKKPARIGDINEGGKKCVVSVCFGKSQYSLYK